MKTRRRLSQLLKAKLLAITLLAFSINSSFSQNISFSQSSLDLNGKGTIAQGTFIQFGPDGRLYVMELEGLVKIFDVQKVGPNNYKVTASETVNSVKNIQNHNDNGASNGTKKREATALLVNGTAANPVLYVSSSDWRVGGPSGDKNLDTNSGVITRLTWNGSSWEAVDIIRGLPRSEENHATHGLEYAVVNGKPYLLVCQGGHTNAGSPSNKFAWSTEYALSGAILAVDLNQINAMPITTVGGKKHIYDVPTLDDPTRSNVNGIEDPNNPGYNGKDINDPWGGNDGLNQGKLELNGPIEIFSPGYRNSYDIAFTQSGAVFVTDNGANGGWGGYPKNEGPGGNVTNEYRPGEPGSSSSDGGEASVNNKDHLTMITNDIQSYNFGSFYGGHPNPVRANPSGAGLFTRGSHSSDPGDSNGNGYTDDWFRTSILGVNNGNFEEQSLPVDWPPVPVSMANPIEGDFRNPGGSNPDGPNDAIVTTLQNNSNGIDEYTASNFGGAMQGNLIIGRSSNLHRIELNPDGSLKDKKHNWTSGLGGNALGVTCNSDSDPFPGTIWVATYNSAIVILEPNDAVVCLMPGDAGYDPNGDNDSDGFTNQDEEDNGTDLCSGSSQPNDFDGDKISDLNDSDDDGDGIADASDPFQMGSPFNLPVVNELFSDQPEWGGYLGLGFTGLMNNGDANPNYLNWLDDPNASTTDVDDIYGGAVGAVTIYQTSGDASSNTQEKAFQYGVNVDVTTDTFVATGRMAPNFHNHLSGQSQAMFIGTGFQDDYIKIGLSGSMLSVEGENGGVPITGLPSLSLGPIPSNIDLIFTIDPVNGMIQTSVSLDDGATQTDIGGPFAAAGGLLTAIQSSTTPMAVGVMGTSGSHPEYAANWDFLNVVQKNTPSVAISLDPIANQTNNEGDNTNVQVNATGGDGNLTYIATGLPGGLSINSNTGVISGFVSAGANTSSPYSVTITVDDSDGDNSDEQTETFNWTINTAPIGGAGDIWLEAECATVGSQWTELTNAGASEGKYLNPPAATSNSSAPSSPDDLVSFTFNTSQAGTYKVFARVQATSGTADSYWVRANGGTWQKWNKINVGSYGIAFQWSQVGNWTSGSSAVPVTFNLVAGSNTIDFSWREKNTNLDKIYITQTGSAPTGNGSVATNCGPVSSPIVVTPISDQINDEGDNANVTVVATGGDGNLTFVANGLPAGVTIDPTNGLIGGTIDAGTANNSPYAITVTIDDSDTDATDVQMISFNWTINNPNAPIPIVLNNIYDQTNSEGDNASIQIDANGGNGALNYQVSGLPTGLTVNATTGLIDGTISAGAFAGSPYAVVITVDDADTVTSDIETTNFTWTINDPNAPIAIVLNSITSQTNDEGDNASLQIDASGGNGALNYQASGLPTGLTVNATTGLIDGTISAGAFAGSPYAVMITVDDADTATADIETTNFTWTINDPNAPIAIVATPIASQQDAEGDNINLQVSASGGNGALTYTATGLPTGLSLDLNSGLISGVISVGASASSPFSVSIDIDDSDADNTDIQTISFNWTVTPQVTSVTDLWLEAECATVGSQWTEVADVNASGGKYLEPPSSKSTVVVPSTPDDFVTFTFDVSQAGAYKIFGLVQVISGQYDSYWVRANGGTWQRWNKINSGNYSTAFQWSQVGHWYSGCCAVPVTFNLVNGTNTVDFSWRKSKTKLDKIFVTLTGSLPTGLGNTSSNCNLQVPISLNTIPNQDDDEGDNINLQVSASGGDGALTYQATGLPAGLTINSLSGEISGVISNGAAAASPYNVTITVDDTDTTNTDVQTTNFTWTVTDPNAPIAIVLNGISNQTNSELDNTSLQVIASGGNGALDYQATGLPTGLTLNSSTGLISGIISAGAYSGSPYSVTITVDDTDGDNTDIETTNFTWTINDPNAPIPIVLNGVLDQTNDELDNVNVQVTASGGNGALMYQASNLPVGLGIDLSTGLITGTISANAYAGSPYNATITVDDTDADNLDIETTNFVWTINDPNAPILIAANNISNQQNDEGDNISLQVTASGGNGPLNYQATGLPMGLTLNPNTGLIDGSVSAGASANSPYSVSITVDDNDADNSDIQVLNFVWEVFVPNVASTDVWLEAECATVGSKWSEVNDAGASGGKYLNPPSTKSTASTPNTIADHVTFSFDVSQAGAYKVFARVQSTSGNDDSYWVRANGGSWQKWNKINSGNYGATFKWSQVGNWSSGCCAVPVTFNLVTGTNKVDFSWREPNTKLDKIFVTLTGSVPSGNGDNSSNCNTGTPISLNSVINQQNFEGDLISLQVNASGGDGTLAYQATGLPSGLSINTGTGLIDGNIAVGAASASPYIVNISVDDSDADNTDIQMVTFNWDVYDPSVGVPISLTAIGNQSNFEGDSPILQVNASGGDGSLSYQAIGLPTGLNISASGLISGTISSGAISSSPFAVSVTVDDADGFNTDAQTTSFNWIVDTVSSTITDSWTNVSNSPDHIAKHENSLVQAGNRFYLLGGRVSPKTLEIYNYNNNSWSTGATVPEDFNHFQATEYDGLIWVIGAFYANNFPNEPPEDKIHIYDPANDEWIQGPTIPSNRRRGSTGLVAYNDKFYVVCGNTIGHDGGYVDWFDEYDPINNTWTALTNAPRARDHFNAALIGDKLYAAGGRLSGGAGGTFAPMISEVDVYDFNTNSWSTLPATQNIPTPRAGTSTVNFKDELVVIGGEGGGDAFSTVEAYDPASASWRTLASMNHKRHGTQAIVSGDGIHTTAGSFKQGGGNQTNMEVYGIDNPVGAPSVAGVLSKPNSVNIVQNNNGNIIIQHTGGNVGIFIRSLQINGVTGGTFSITNGNPGSGGFLLKTGSSHTIEVTAGNNTDGESANLVINYGKNSSTSVTINGVASSSPSRQVVGNADALNRAIKVYPNPTSGQPQLNVALSLPEADRVDFKLLDMTGKLIYESKDQLIKAESITKIPVGGIAKGVYLLQVQGQSWQEYKRVTIN